MQYISLRLFVIITSLTHASSTKYFFSNMSLSRQDGQTFLAVFQSSFQKRLMKVYGSYLALMDATYRVSVYDIPLSQIVVPTNVGYFVTATFITESEKKDAVFEALSILRDKNPRWRPSAFLVDFDERQISAISDVFPGELIYHCDTYSVFVSASILLANVVLLCVSEPNITFSNKH